MKKLGTSQAKPLAVRVFLQGGPWNGQTARLSGYAPKETLTFTVRGRTGRYVRTVRGSSMKWEAAQ